MRTKPPNYLRMSPSRMGNPDSSATGMAHLSHILVIGVRLFLLALAFFGFIVIYTVLASETDVAHPKKPKTAAQALWYGVMVATEQTAALAIHRNLVPDVWNGRFSRYVSAFGLNTLLWYWMSYYDGLRSNRAAVLFIAICRGLSISFATFGLPALIMAHGRGLNLLDFKSHKCFWICVFPISIGLLVATQDETVVGSETHLTGQIFCVGYTLVMFLVIVVWDGVIHDEIGYTVIVSAVSIYAMQGIGISTSLVHNVSRTLANAYLATIIPIIFVKVLFIAFLAFLEEIIFKIHTATKESKYPPIFALQLSEDLIISTLYLEQSLSSQFAASLIFLTSFNLVRDAGWVSEIYCRYLKGLRHEKQVALYMGQKYFQVQQNMVAEFIALSSIFVLVITEYLLNGFQSPMFTEGLSRSRREELLVVYAISITVRVPMSYVAWKFFKKRLKSLRAASSLANGTLTNAVAGDHGTDRIVHTAGVDSLGLELIVSKPVSESFANSFTPSAIVKSDRKHEQIKTKRGGDGKSSNSAIGHMLRQGKIVNDLLRLGHFTRATISYWKRNKMTLALLAITGVLALRFYIDDV